MKKFEYCSGEVVSGSISDGVIGPNVTAMGKDGWELCTIVPFADDQYKIFWKRELAKDFKVNDQEDAARWRKLKELCGYVQNGSDTAVKLAQDDATRTYFIYVGNESYYGTSFNSVLATIPDGQD